MKPRGKIREKLDLGGILTLVFAMCVLVFVTLAEARPWGDTEYAVGESYVAEAGGAAGAGAGAGAIGEADAGATGGTGAATMPEIDAEFFEFPGEMLFWLMDDESIQGLNVGTSGNIVLGVSGFLMEAGWPTFTIVEFPFYDGFNSIRVSGRNNTWYTLDFPLFLNNSIDLSQNSYTIFISGRATPGIAVPLRAMDSPWNWLAHAHADDDGFFSMWVEISDTALRATEGGIGQFSERGFRIQPEDLNDFTVYDVMIMRQ